MLKLDWIIINFEFRYISYFIKMKVKLCSPKKHSSGVLSVMMVANFLS